MVNSCWSFTTWQRLRTYQESGWVLTWESAHSWWFHSAVPLADRPSHEQHDLIPHPVTLSCHWANQSLSILIMLSVWLRSDKYKVWSLWFDPNRVRTHGFESHELPKRPSLFGKYGAESGTNLNFHHEAVAIWYCYLIIYIYIYILLSTTMYCCSLLSLPRYYYMLLDFTRCH